MTDANIMRSYNPLSPEVVVFWGAGATVGLGGISTNSLAEILSALAGMEYEAIGFDTRRSESDPKNFNYRATVRERIDAIRLSRAWPEPHRRALEDLLIILKDGDGCSSEEDATKNMEERIEKRAQHYATEFEWQRYGLECAPDKEKIKEELRQWHTRYDWLALKSLFPVIARQMRISKRSRGPVNLQDFLTALDQLITLSGGVPAVEFFVDDRLRNDIYTIRPDRLPAARDAAVLLISTIERLAFQQCDGYLDKEKAKPYIEFVEAMCELSEVEAREHAADFKADQREFYLGSLAFISLNWDPLLQWLWFNANRQFNHRLTRPRFYGQRDLLLYHDQGSDVGARTIAPKDRPGSDKRDVFFTFTEQAAQRLNDDDHKNGPVYRINKLLQIHGGLQWRACPRCSKVFTSAPQEWEYLDGSMLGPGVFPEICPRWKPSRKFDAELREWREGRFGALTCIHCGYMTQPQDTPLLVQTVTKSSRHYLQTALFHEMGVMAGKAKHIVLIGYSLPPDDVVNRCYLQSSFAGRNDSLFVTVVTFDRQNKSSPRFVGVDGFMRGDGLWDYLRLNPATGDVDEGAYAAVKNAVEVFGADNMRVSLDGFPGVLSTLRNGSDMQCGLKKLFYPEGKPGFPPRRIRST